MEKKFNDQWNMPMGLKSNGDIYNKNYYGEIV